MRRDKMAASACARRQKQSPPAIQQEVQRPMLRVFFTAVYFLVFVFFIDLVFRNTHHIVTDLLTIVCWVVALIVSVGLADYTVKKIQERGPK